MSLFCVLQFISHKKKQHRRQAGKHCNEKEKEKSKEILNENKEEKLSLVIVKTCHFS